MSTLDAALIVARLLAGVWLFWRVRVPRHRRADQRAPVAIVVPARDEERSLGALLASLEPGPDDEVVVVDDHSSDDTATVATRAGARLVAAPEVPDGWTGKSWACAVGAEATQAPVLAFVDADVWFGPGGLDAVLAEHAARGGLVSVQPRHHPIRLGEHLALLCNVVGFAATGAASPLGSSAGAFGPVLATRRDDLDGVGGHAAVRGSIVEDLALAERYRAAGLPVTVFGGGELVGFRMYPGGLPDVVGGFRKNLAAGLAGVRSVPALLVVAWLSLLVQAAGWLLRAPVTGEWVPAVALYVLVALQVAWIGRRLGSFSAWWWLAFPVPLAVFLWVFVRSFVDVARGRTTWKGREVSLRTRRRRS